MGGSKCLRDSGQSTSTVEPPISDTPKIWTTSIQWTHVQLHCTSFLEQDCSKYKGTRAVAPIDCAVHIVYFQSPGYR